ncbi:MAG: tRNA uridine-5-carboxymethylaminomethyl(34) synthesis GTPase MnmE [Hyphomicrobiales bacterium]|nr:tRNA uridine-5-carboxymethylaminomethyl(34) synthesis GTPase MnmE [Hyphomicrobiales bacterium]MBV8824580.1 tRNA uridine-5-carboxymethylaminomethyl(34) synthesis GTPase MnmE [Hyphomicrobiales bacterium]MBV9429420.1 tRNA uridine-5-carboxymethylaminomethyl(34) synthesis GTPase MnmE [Bradyrhizobiaceae bacterium]
MTRDRDTIFALSSGRPPVAVAVIRVSGPAARTAVETLAGRVPEPRRARFATLRDRPGGDVLDPAVVLWFPGPHSETGQDVAEFQVHGGRAVITAVLAALGRIEGLRPAEPGEFTRRAFENGRLDLTAVEGLADLIYAETEAQRRQAYRQLAGTLGKRAEAWRAQLIEAQALVEAGIDFSDEGDVPEKLLGPALATARALREEIAAALADENRGERLREGLMVAIAGPPNAGKSSLLNRLAQRDVAIVTPHAGTTRDVIEVHLDLGSYPVTLLDTAGIRESQDPVEIEGVRRARERAEAADLVLWVTEEGVGAPVQDSGQAEVWQVRNKIDLADAQAVPSSSGKGLRISALTGAGVPELIAALARHAEATLAGAEASLVTRERHRVALRKVVEALDRALAEGSGGREDIVAEELRLAARELGRLTGRVDVEDILDVIFRDFCVGK